MIRFILALLLSLALASCSSRADQYDQLCRIFEETEGLYADDPATLAVHRSERVSQEIPELADTLSLLAQADPSEKYTLLVAVAEHEIGQPWRCDAIASIYQTN